MKAQRKLPSRPVALGLAVAALVAGATPIAAVELLPRPSALPALQDGQTRITISENGRTRVYSSVEEMDPEARQTYERSMEQAAEARAHAEEARIHAAAAHREAERVRASIDYAAIDRAREEGLRAAEEGRRAAEEGRRQAELGRREAERAREEGRRAAEEGRRHAELGRQEAERAREEARHAMVEARAEMGRGADQMESGAEEMREEARRLRGPAYRARMIEENRQRGHTVTDAELIDLSRRLPEQADDMVRQAQRMREQAARDL